MDLQRAREKLERSKKAMAAGQYEDARRLAETAQVEAQLAEAKADAEITQLAADTLRQRSDALRQEIERGVTRRPPAASKE
jgi:cell division protein FtsB